MLRCFDPLLTSVQLSISLAENEFIFFSRGAPERSRVPKSTASLGWIQDQATMAAASRHAQDEQTNFKLLLDTFLPPPKRSTLHRPNVAKRSGLAQSATLTCSRPCKCRHLGRCRRAAVGSGACYCAPSPVLSSSVPPSLPTVLSYLLLSSSSRCHSVTLHLLAPLSLSPSPPPRLSLSLPLPVRARLLWPPPPEK